MTEMQVQVRPPFFQRLLTPFERFVRRESASGLLLIAAAIAAFAWTNLGSPESYHHLKEYPVGIHIGEWALNRPLEWWVNDGLMALFFLLVGLEIKREVLVGELAGLQRALWPVTAAIGGMLVPAAIYAALNWNSPSLRGWGIPMATDIAFALGVMSLLGKRVPVSLKIFLTALAIADDLGAVLVIAIFYTQSLHWLDFGTMAALLGLCVLYGRTGGRRLSVFAALGIPLWYVTYHSGVHPTVAGVLLAMTVPICPRRRALPKLHATPVDPQFEEMEVALQHAEQELTHLQSPLHRLEHALTPWVAFGIMPAFALFNAGVALHAEVEAVSPASLGVSLGLLLGKPVGIVGASWLAARLRWIVLPDDVSWPAMIGTGLLGGIGFTMSLFIAMLAFPNNPDTLDQAKLAVLATSTVAALAGLVVLLLATRRRRRVAVAQ